MKAKTIDRRLGRALQERRRVRLWRDELDEHSLDGYVLATGERWLLLAVLADDLTPDGWTCVRRKDVTRAYNAPAQRFHQRAVELRGHWPPLAPPGSLDLSTRRRLLLSIAAVSTVLTVHPEKWRSDVSYIGVVVGTSRKTLRLLEIGPDAEWADEPALHDLRDITKIDFGNGYEEALLLVGGVRLA